MSNVRPHDMRQFSVFVFLAAGVARVLAAQPALERYANDRYGFSMAYPVGYAMQRPPDNGDGRVFSNKQGCTVLAYGSNNVLGETLSSRGKQVAAEFDHLDKRVVGRNWQAVYGRKGSARLYVKTFVGPKAINELRIVQPISEPACKIPVPAIVRGFRPGSLRESH